MQNTMHCTFVAFQEEVCSPSRIVGRYVAPPDDLMLFNLGMSPTRPWDTFSICPLVVAHDAV